MKNKLLLTKNRKIILDVLKDSVEPLNAEQIYEKVLKSIDLSTVYRTLEKFMLYDIINRSIIDKTSYYYIKTDKHHHYMICEICHSMTEISCRVTDMLKEIIDEIGFKVTSHDLTVYGYCSNCQNK